MIDDTLATRQKPKLDLRPETKKFLDICNQYLKCRKLMDAKYQEVDECHKIARYNIARNYIAESSEESRIKLQQQAIDGTPAKSLAEVYQAAEQIQPTFENTLARIVQQVEEKLPSKDESIKVIIAPLKGRNRAKEKAEDDYIDRMPGPEVTWLYDIVRGSLAFSTADQVLCCLEILENDPLITMVKVKNRFQNPTLTGYRDINVCLKLQSKDGSFCHICEVQIHHFAIRTLEKELKSHTYYEYFRTYFSGATEALEERLNDLRLISEGAGELLSMDESFLTQMLEETTDEERLMRLANLFDQQLCEHDWALAVLQRLLEIRIEIHGTQHYVVADSYNRLGNVLQKKSELDLAMEAYKKALAIFSGILPTGHLDFTGTLASVNTVLRSQGKVNESVLAHGASLTSLRDLFNDGNDSNVKMRFKSRASVTKTQDSLMKVMDQFQRDLDHAFQPSSGEPLDGVLKYIHVNNMVPENPAIVVNNAIQSYKSSLAAFHQAEGGGLSGADPTENVSAAIHALNDFETVLRTFRHSLQHMARIFVELQSKLAIIYNNQATVLQHQGDLDGAMDQFQTSLAIKKKSLGEDNAQVAERYVYLGHVLELLKRPKIALGRYEKALLILRRNLGDDHSLVADTLVRLASVQSGQGQRDEAMEHYIQAIGIYKRTLGEEHLSIANAYIKVGDMHRVQRKHEDALEMYQQALTIQKVALGKNDMMVGETYKLISPLLRKQGKNEEADEAYHESLRIKRNFLSQDQSTWIDSELTRARALFKRDAKYNEALEAFQSAVDVSMEAMGPGDPSLAQIYNEMACVLSEQGTPGRAMMLHYKALGLLQKAHGTMMSDEIAETYIMMGATLLEQSRLEKALKLYGDAVGFFSGNKDDSKLAETYRQMANALSSTGHEEKAKEYRAKADAVPQDND